MDQFVNDHHKLEVKDSHETIIQGYKKIKKENPEYWATLLLEMIEAVDDEENGSNSSATLTNMNGTHMGLLHDQIAVEKNDKFKLCVVIAVKALILVGGFAWAIYGQITGTATHTPTNAPTNNPTYSPTFFPTQSPI
jgi:hypothetical protein